METKFYDLLDKMLGSRVAKECLYLAGDSASALMAFLLTLTTMLVQNPGKTLSLSTTVSREY